MAPRPKATNDWARLGASVRLAQIETERTTILKAFPDLRRGAPAAAAAVSGPRPRRVMSAKARAAMSAGMKRYWAKRKAGH